MSKLTFAIKPNDEVTLKYNLQDYVGRIVGRNFSGRRNLDKECCKDPQYVAQRDDLLLFRGKTVVIEYASIKYRFTEDGIPIGSYYYISVRDRSGNICEFPIEFIDRSHCLIRDHHITCLHNKILICK